MHAQTMPQRYSVGVAIRVAATGIFSSPWQPICGSFVTAKPSREGLGRMPDGR
jgi:hypothetical protein